MDEMDGVDEIDGTGGMDSVDEKDGVGWMDGEGRMDDLVMNGWIEVDEMDGVVGMFVWVGWMVRVELIMWVGRKL